MALSTDTRMVLHATLVAQIRQFIAGAILFNQRMADRAGLHLTDMQCINLLELLGPVTPGRLAECTGLTTGGVTVMLDRLETAGYIKREPNPQDRRSLLIKANPRKLQKIHGFYAALDAQFSAFLADTPEEELRTVTKFLTRVNTVRRMEPER